MAAKKRMTKKQRRRSLRAAALACLEMELTEEDQLRKELERRGLDPCGGQAVLFGQWVKAAGGDTSAAKFLRDTAGGEEQTERRPGRDELAGLTDEELREVAKGG